MVDRGHMRADVTKIVEIGYKMEKAGRPRSESVGVPTWLAGYSSMGIPSAS